MPSYIHIAICFLCAIKLASLPIACEPRTESEKPAQIHITSTPPGATVLLNGRHEGLTPTTLMRVPPGRHLLILRKSGYREARTTISASPGERVAIEMNMEPVTGIVLIHSRPSGADVEINNAAYGQTPLLLPQMPLGQYRLRVSAPGHLPKVMDMTVADRTPMKINVPLVSDSARVTINSTPPGANIVIGGIARGTTPYVIETMPSGKHQLELTMRGYETHADEFVVNPGDRRQINIILTPRPGTLAVSTRPTNARIYLDGQIKGESPLSVTNMPAGEYVVSAELRGYETAVSTNTVAFGEKTLVEFDLVKNSGMLLISTEPPGVRVYIDGEDHGTTVPSEDDPVSAQMPIDLVPRGTRQIQLTRQGYFDLIKSVEITPDRMIVLHEKLKLRPVPFVPNVIIRTGPGPEHTFRGIVREEYADGTILFEIAPGIVRSFKPSDIISREPIRMD